MAVGDLTECEVLNEHIGLAVALGLCDRHRFQDCIEVVPDAEALKDARLL